MSLGLYISVPFCKTKCSYCNFASDVFSRAVFECYVERVIADVNRAGETAEQMGGGFEPSVDSIFLGGGTPTILDITQLERLFVTISQKFVVREDAEITVECAPGTLSPPMIESLRRCGVNRVSLGVQSFVDIEAASVGRLHERNTVLEDIARLRAAGIENINIDLIAGLPYQTAKSWEFSVAETVATGVPHVSVYMLEVDDDSRLGRELIAGGARYHAHFVPDDEATADFYEAACRRLDEAGVCQYEISNFARPGQESRHNLKYWIVASARALMSRTLPRREFLANTRTIKVGQALRIEKALEGWVGAGYVPATIVIEPGQFARRGGIVDIFPATSEQPVRIELFGDEIETLRRFDPATQRSGDRVQSVSIGPAREALPRYWQPEWQVEVEEDSTPGKDSAPGSDEGSPRNLEFYLPRMMAPASLLEYLPEAAVVMVDDWRELSVAVEELEEQAIELRAEQLAAGILDNGFPLPYHPWAELQDELADRRPAPLIMAAPEDDTTPVIDLGAHFHPGPRFGGQLKLLLGHLDGLQGGFDRGVVVTRQAERLAEMWGEQHPYRAPIAAVEQLPEPGEPVFVHGALSDGFRLDVPDEAPGPAYSLHVLTDSEIFGWVRSEGPRIRRRARAAAQSPEANYADLADGDYVVHMDYGVGRFRGLVNREVERVEREYLLIEYAEGDELYVPIHQADRLTRYVGVSEEHEPALSRLGSPDWTATKGRAELAVKEVAQDLLDLYAKREATHGHNAGPDTIWQAELEASFPYPETEDQLRAIREVKADMESPRPMDRLICGDVGYGKTEVALRAAFKAVMDGSQVAVLVPTTVLAQQHLHTFQARLGPYPVQVEMLSRFRSRAEADAIVQRLGQGQIDIIIGTHRLVQKDVLFKNLGLVIIDEEQRFGVTHKEYFKKLRTEVDVLTLTATPIPRTLYLSLTGVRDISTINTPPEDRLPVVNHAGPFNDRLVRQAILRELDRDGQVFFVHNRVQTIGVMLRKLEELVPEARIGVAHGQMDEHQLSRVMDQFTAGELDVLLCTSIIESGLDIPNANTLIVDRADTFGLAQLYQLRGRVGRAAARAYAYFLTDRRHRPTPDGYQRLETLTEQSDLGAGFGIAMRDLEMRGAGDILGARQHGHITAVGFHLYTRLLGDAVKRLRAQSPEGVAALPLAQPADSLSAGLDALSLPPVAVDLPVAASLPSDYIEERDLRLRIYRRLADIRAEGQLDEVAQELSERFGPLPRPVQNLVFQLRVKILAGRAGATAIGTENGQIVLTVPTMGELDQAYLGSRIGPGARVSKNRVWLGRAADLRADDAPWRRQLLNLLRELGNTEPAAP